ncbi:MAG: hypothetical protein M1426_03805 [Patescibacteria group bacterium]|nr:hypothetical protein [Patescibacteria group bacterium]
MILCKVLGNVTATIKHPGYHGKIVMMVQPVSIEDLSPIGASFLAVDTVQAGPGEIVWVNKEGGSSLIAVREEHVPIHSTITGIIDTINVKRL